VGLRKCTIGLSLCGFIIFLIFSDLVGRTQEFQFVVFVDVVEGGDELVCELDYISMSFANARERRT